MRSGLTVLVLLTTVACATAHHEQAAQSPLRLSLAIESVTSGAGQLSVEMTILNPGPGSVAFTPTFGFPDLYLVVEIRDAWDKLVPYPPDFNWELFSEPRYTCLRPGRKRSLRADLHHWNPVVGGETWTDSGPYSFNLPKGHYKARLRYEPPGPVRHRFCPTSASAIASEWVSFEIP